MKKNIFIVDDEPDIVELIKINLEKSGYIVRGFCDGESMLNYISQKYLPDLIILDIMLPQMDGMEIAKQLKFNPDTTSIPIIFLSAKNEDIDKITGLEIGADDYITKPFNMRELIARIKAVMRRGLPEKPEGKTIKIDNILRIDPNKFEVYVKDRKVELTTTEFRILYTLAKKPGWVFSREQLLNELWGDEKVVIDRTIDVHIRNLREKLKEASKLIQNIRGVGYKIDL
ncbi:MAG: response regulator transcription factor [Deltaproteobacteria bacterium]|nr:response regulator transcription factor [Deltaproteobacteria bacterium]